MKQQESRFPPGGADRPGILLVGALARSASPGSAASARLHPCASGAAALRLAADPSVGPKLEAVFADAQLVDMTGTGLLDRISLVLPQAARVVLTDDGPADELADRPASALVTDVWPVPAAPDALLARFVRERRALRRMHALQCQLGEIHEALDVLRDRYTNARRTRDRVVASVAALHARTAGSGHRGSWWEDFAQLTSLEETGCPAHPERLGGAALADALRCAGAEAPQSFGAVEVLADPTLLGEILTRIVAGLERAGAPGARALATSRVLAGRSLAVTVEIGCTESPDPDRLLDPLAYLPDTREDGAPLDLPLAEALCRAQGSGHRLRLDIAPGRLCALLELPLAPGRAATGPRTRPVVREVDRTL